MNKIYIILLRHRYHPNTTTEMPHVKIQGKNIWRNDNIEKYNSDDHYIHGENQNRRNAT